MKPWFTPLALAIALFAPVSVRADEPLHVEIDRLIAADAVGIPAPLATDGEFLRRVSIDFIGMPPTFEELQAFLADTSSTKRSAVIDRLIASPEFARNLATFFDVMLMERRKADEVTADDWNAYLLKSMQENKPYNVLVRELMTAESYDPAKRTMDRFFLDRDGEPNVVTRDIGRIFFGVDLQCAQCHDHPLISDYKQTEYHGLLAFFKPSSNLEVMEGGKKKSYYVEKAASDVAFESVFVKGVKHIVAPQLPEEPEITEPAFYPGDEYLPKPEGAKPAPPKYSRRARFAELVTGGQNRMFNENIANRLWAYMLGRGLVSPPDLRHAGNPPTHPELLRRLGERFAEMKFNVPAFLKEIALTQAYQRSIDRPANVAAAAETAVSTMASLLAEQAALKPKIAAAREGEAATLKEWNAAQLAVLPVMGERDGAVAKSQEVLKKRDAANKAVVDAKAAVTAKEGIANSLNEAATKAGEVTKLLPMDAELVAATAKFAERLATVKTEVEALKKTVTEKETALVPVNEELAVSRKAIDAVNEKLNPLRDACRAKHDAWAAARTAMLAVETTASRLDQRILTAKSIVDSKALEAQVAAVEKTMTESKAVAESSMARMAQMTNPLTAADAAYQTAIRDQATAATTVAEAKATISRTQDTVKALEAAITSSGTALEKLPNDAALTQAVDALKKRKGELEAAAKDAETALATATAAEQAASTKRVAAQTAFEEAVAERGRRKEAAEAAQAAVEAAKARLEEARSTAQTALATLTGYWSNDGLVASLKPLTPEQMCASVFRVTGIYENYRAVEVAELDKSAPMTDADKQDPVKLAARQRDLEQRVYDKLVKPNRPNYVRLYGGSPGAPQDEFFASADQALYTANGDAIVGWSGQQGNNVTKRVLDEPDNRKSAKVLYETILCRQPTDEESADVENYLNSRPKEQKLAAAQELVWSLIASVEFRLNH